MHIILIGLMALIPLVVWPGQSAQAFARMEKEILMQVAAVLTLGSMFIRPVSFTFNNRWVFAFVAYAIILQFTITKGELYSMVAIFNLLCGLTLVIGFASIEKKHLVIILKVIFWSAIIQCLIGWFQYFGYEPMLIFFEIIKQKGFNNFVGGTFYNPILLGTYLACVLPISIFYFKSWWGSPLILGTMILCDSTTAWFAVIISTLYFSFFKNRKLFIIILVLLILLSIMFIVFSCSDTPPEQVLFKDRLSVWQKAMFGWRIKEDTGWGPGSWGYLMKYNMATSAYHKDAHCDYIQILFEYGKWGFCIFIGFLFNLLKSYVYVEDDLKHCFASILISIAVLGIALFPLEYTPTSTLAIFAVGGIYALKHREISA